MRDDGLDWLRVDNGSTDVAAVVVVKESHYQRVLAGTYNESIVVKKISLFSL